MKGKANKSLPRARSLRALILEDNPLDAELDVAILKRVGYSLTSEVVDSLDQFQERLEQGDYDVILADYNLRTWTALDALQVLKKSAKDIPLIVVTGTIGDEAAVECIKQGATDYVLKHRIQRLPVAVERALRDKAHREEAARLEEQIGRAKKEWELTFDTVPDPVLVIDEQCRIQRANRAAAALLGLEPAQIVGKGCHEVLHATSEPRADCPHQLLLQSGHEERGDIHEPRLGKFFAATASPLHDPTGNLRGCVHVLHDITDRKQAEEALREANETLRALIQASPLGIVLLDPEGVVKLWNPAAERMFGWSAAEVLGGPLPTVPEDKREEHRALHSRVLRGEELFEVEVSRRKKDGAPIDISISSAPVRDAEGNVRGMVGIMADISHRKWAEEALQASEERYRDLFENASDIIYTYDLEGNFTSLNKAGERLTGYTRAEALRMNIAQVLAPAYVEPLRQAVQRMLSGEPPDLSEMEIKAKGGRHLRVEVSPRLIYEERKVVGVQGIARDITERKHLEDQLRQAQKMEAVGRLAGGIAHDFNNLLMAIAGYGELLLNRLANGDPMRKYAEEIKKAGDRAASLTRQLLAFSRRQVLEPQVLDLNTVVANMGKMLRRVIGEDIELVTVNVQDLGRIKADPVQIEQVILNLAVNARDAMPQGGKLTLETANVELDEAYARSHVAVTPGSYVMLAMSDTGCGMDAETQSHIFEPFFTTKEQGKGTGLGLATVYGIVKQSGGNIWLYSEVGRGTTIKIYLPRVTEPVAAPKAAETLSAVARGTETILLVEDDGSVRSLIRGVLEGHGYQVLEARHGEDALLVCEQHKGPIHLLVTDVVMPEMSGPELADHLAPFHREMKVLYMSGYTEDATLHRGTLDPGSAYLQKPFPPEMLVRKVREILDGVRASKPMPGRLSM